MDLDALRDRIGSRAAEASRPIVVGISGYGGSGKSTLARALVGQIDGAVRLRGDDFLSPERSHRRSRDWDGVERGRLVAQVLAPFREQRPGRFQRLDWTARALGEPEPVPAGRVLLVDLVGLFHPEALPMLDLTLWCDVDLDTAARRGLRRDEALGRDHSRLWREVWVPNERDFDAAYAPRTVADIRYRAAPAEACGRSGAGR